MKKLLKAALFLMLGARPCFATQVDVKLQTKIHNGTTGGARIPTRYPVITADITDDMLTSSISDYYGIIHVYICDADDNVIADYYINTYDADSQCVSIAWLDEGVYTLHYIVGDFHFMGEFSI